jgi:hypothetical protein
MPSPDCLSQCKENKSRAQDNQGDGKNDGEPGEDVTTAPNDKGCDKTKPEIGDPGWGDDLKNKEYYERIRQKGNDDFPGEHNSALRHCVASCYGAGNRGGLKTWVAGIVNEGIGFGRWGIACASAGNNSWDGCDSCCARALALLK